MSMSTSTNESREKELEELYGTWIKALDNQDTGYGVVFFDVENIQPAGVDYGKAIEYVMIIILKCLKISNRYGNDQVTSLVRLEGSTPKNFSYKFVKYISDMVTEAFPGKLKVAHIMRPKGKIYKSLVLAFFKMMKYCTHKEAYDKLKLL